MLIQIDQFRGFSDRPQRRLPDVIFVANERDNRAVVIDVHLQIQDGDSGNRTDRCDDGVKDSEISPFAKVGYALDEGCHSK